MDDEDLSARAPSGWRRYGKDHHPANLPILCTGNDFAATGIVVVRPQVGSGPAR